MKGTLLKASIPSASSVPLVAADSLLKQPGWSELNMWELMVGKTTFLKLSEEHCHHQIQSSTDPVCQLVELSMKIETDLLISCWLGMLFGIWDASECSLCGRNGSWEDKVTEKSFETQILQIRELQSVLPQCTFTSAFNKATKGKKVSLGTSLWNVLVIYAPAKMSYHHSHSMSSQEAENLMWSLEAVNQRKGSCCYLCIHRIWEEWGRTLFSMLLSNQKIDIPIHVKVCLGKDTDRITSGMYWEINIK